MPIELISPWCNTIAALIDMMRKLDRKIELSTDMFGQAPYRIARQREQVRREAHRLMILRDNWRK